MGDRCLLLISHDSKIRIVTNFLLSLFAFIKFSGAAVIERIYISVLCGGQSTEHEVSIESAKHIVSRLDCSKYLISIIFINHIGQWHLINDPAAFLTSAPDELVKEGNTVPIIIAIGDTSTPWQSLKKEGRRYPVDCIFPIVHGTQGEDGAIQGLLELLNVPYIGSGVKSSVICIEKDITKTLLRAGGIPVVDWYVLLPKDSVEGLYQKLIRQWNVSELFVKAVSLGSSVAIFLTKTEKEFIKAIEEVFRYDDRLLIEPRIFGQEIECAILGNKIPKASFLSEIISHHSYYSYDAKYRDLSAVTTTTLIELPKCVIKKIQQIAIDAFKMVYCSGMARVDFFVISENEIIVNEINTIPGFTDISMYPKMWEASGLPFQNLLDQLIELAIDHHRERNKLIRYYPSK